MIIDSHAHFWNAEPNPGPATERHHDPILVEDFIRDMDEAGVDKLIQITRGMMGFDNRYSLEGAARFPDRIRVMVRFDAGVPDWLDQLRLVRDHPHIVGIRMMTIAKDEAAYFDGNALVPFWAAAQDFGVPISLYAPERSGLVADIAARYPGLKLIVDHVGMRVFDIFRTPPSLDDWPNMLALNRFPNVCIKVSGLAEALVDSAPFPRSKVRLAEIYDRFGPDRMIWGSNYPPVTQVCSYRQSREYISECDFLTEDDKSRILGQTAISVLGLDWT